ncbi:MAG: PH domain-containing protein [Clostridia bacterium]|nr:PH domain-containing protein [Clostridia bacterium]
MNNSVKPNYVIKKSAWSVIKWWHIVFGIFIIPLIIMIVKIINIKDESISFYNNKVVHKSGIFSKHEKTTILTRVLSVTVRQTFWGRIFNYGTIYVDMMGKWDISMRGIKNPMGAKAYLEKFVANGTGMRQILTN